jgi:membrane protein DedA with SNARE-associated domain
MMEAHLLEWMHQYGYAILFLWTILEGESGLVMAGLFVHTGDMALFNAIATAGVGAFVGDQLYYYVGRYKKAYVIQKFASQRRKFALAKLLLREYGVFIIFVQRYLYGLRTIIPLSIGLMGYSPRTFALINFISAWCWSALIIVPVWYFGNTILSLIAYVKAHWYVFAPIALLLFGSFLFYGMYRKKKVHKNA